jgi:hypothetical protein
LRAERLKPVWHSRRESANLLGPIEVGVKRWAEDASELASAVSPLGSSHRRSQAAVAAVDGPALARASISIAFGQTEHRMLIVAPRDTRKLSMAFAGDAADYSRLSGPGGEGTLE